MSAPQDPLVRAYWSTARWRGARSLVLAAIFGTAALGFAGAMLTPPEQPEAPVSRPSPTADEVPVAPERLWTDTVAPMNSDGWSTRTLEPRIENRGDTWVGLDVLHVEQIELRVSDGPASVEPAVREWAARVCDAEPRPFYLTGFDDVGTVDALSRMLVDACPSFRIHRVELAPMCRCGLVGAPPHPH